MKVFNRFAGGAALALMLSGAINAQDNSQAARPDKGVMHCFLFTPQTNVTEAQWQDFFKATSELPKQIPGLTQVWYGELRRPFPVLMFGEGASEARQKLRAGAESVEANVRQVVRNWGVCMAFSSADAFAGYADNPAHRAWEQVYSKVRQSPTSTFDIVTK